MFTLIELLIVIAINAVSVALILPAVQPARSVVSSNSLASRTIDSFRHGGRFAKGMWFGGRVTCVVMGATKAGSSWYGGEPEELSIGWVGTIDCNVAVRQPG